MSKAIDERAIKMPQTLKNITHTKKNKSKGTPRVQQTLLLDDIE